MRMNKKPLNLLVNEDLVKTARKHGINLSAFFELKLLEHLEMYYGKTKSKYNKCSRRDSNPCSWLERPE